MRAVGAKFPPSEAELNASGEESGLDAMPPEKRRAMEEVATKHGFKDL
jgi:hypothetical protein